MISYIKGELAEILPDVIVVEANGIGYNIYVPGSVLGELPSVGSEVKIYTYMNVKEDECSLFGFLTRDDLSMFKMLICVNGIGPKAALGALSNITADDLRFAVLADDVAAIKALPGIGPKTAQKIIIELKDKLKLDDVFESALSKNKKADNNSNVSNSNTLFRLISTSLISFFAIHVLKCEKITVETDATMTPTTISLIVAP